MQEPNKKLNQISLKAFFSQTSGEGFQLTIFLLMAFWWSLGFALAFWGRLRCVILVPDFGVSDYGAFGDYAWLCSAFLGSLFAIWAHTFLMNLNKCGNSGRKAFENRETFSRPMSLISLNFLQTLHSKLGVLRLQFVLKFSEVCARISYLAQSPLIIFQSVCSK